MTTTPSNGTNTVIPITIEETREGLRLERALALQHDLMHVAQNDLQRYTAHLAELYGVPPGWQLHTLRGFEPPPEGGNDG